MASASETRSGDRRISKIACESVAKAEGLALPKGFARHDLPQSFNYPNMRILHNTSNGNVLS